ncbi:Transcriptional antiterminator [Atopostipes suicloacalis DSM 15692]|uniref:Transcriptional antiterminator n=1 Tax=Atopostipes suicloacalis DSM 15692 TaxID=1121025 RepID=A0A1M4X027_9LACT|nr:BglG family transcription antiterminator [Atopostipes suicloacalis]SHE86727.1 Transcriptional antiterminator [Atopostipes suicloacalis DSM 15692]
MKPNHIKLIKIITEKNIMSYNEIIDLIGWSRYRINKYINEINDFFEKMDYNLEIVIHPRMGISLEGEITEKDKIISSMEYIENTNNDRRIIQTLSALLDAKGWLTIQKLADDLFVSKSTFENILKEVRNLLENYGLEIEGSKKGIKLDATEENKRKLIAKIISTYKNKLVAYSNPKEELEISIKMSDDIKQFINYDIINQVADVLIKFSKMTNLYLTEYEFNTLAIHIAISLERIDKEFVVEGAKDNSELELNTLTLIKELEDKFDVNLPKYEKEYMNVHINSIQSNTYNRSDYADELKITDNDLKFKNLDEILEEALSGLNPDQELMNGLSLHLKSAVNRLSNNISIANPYLDEIKTNFIQAFEYSKRIIFHIEKKYNIKFDEDEIAYVSMHIQSFLEREKTITKTDLLLVCGSGYGTAKLLEQRILSVFKNRVNIIDRIGINKLSEISKNNELIITTVPIEANIQNSVYVSPLLNEKDILRIEKKLSSKTTKNNSFINLLSKNFFKIDSNNLTQTEIIKYMAGELTSKDIVTSEVYERIMEREKLSTTAIRNFAMPHAEIPNSDEPIIYVYINKNGIQWGKDKVSIVFLFLLNESVKDELNNIYSFFYDLISSEVILHSLINVDSYEEFIHILKKEVKK